MRIPRPGLDVFISYAHKDEDLCQALEAHLSPLQRQGLVRTWHDRLILPGAEWKGQIDDKLASADIVLLLVSRDFLASDYCWDVEMTRALERHDAGQARVIPSPSWASPGRLGDGLRAPRRPGRGRSSWCRGST